jgi:ribosome-binding ATPase YchF (GTP1/OBG family)
MLKIKYAAMLKAQNILKNNTEIRNVEWSNDEAEVLNSFLFLTSKPMIYLINLSKSDYLAGNIPNLPEL